MNELQIPQDYGSYQLPACTISQITIDSDGLSGFSIKDENGILFDGNEVSYAKNQSPLYVSISCPNGAVIENSSHGSAMTVTYESIV